MVLILEKEGIKFKRKIWDSKYIKYFYGAGRFIFDDNISIFDSNGRFDDRWSIYHPTCEDTHANDWEITKEK